MGKKTEEIRKKIEIAEKKKGKPLTKEQKQKIEKDVLKKHRRQAAVRGFLVGIGGLIGLGAGAGGMKLLEEGKYKGIETDKNVIEMDASKIDKDISIENLESDREIFLNDLKVTFDDAQKIEMQKLEEQAQRNEIGQIINNLTTEDMSPEEAHDAVVNYLKQYYVDEYNKDNEEKLDISNIVEISKTRSGVVNSTMYKSEAENGDKIIRNTSEKINYNDLDRHEMIKVIIENSEGRTVEKATNYNGNYVKVYNSDDNVQKYEDNILTEKGLAKVLDAGIDYATYLENKDILNSRESKQQLEDAIYEYESNAQNKDINKQDKDYEIGE